MSRWTTHLITPNEAQARAEYNSWVARGYHSHFSRGGNLVEIKKAGPAQSIFYVRTRQDEASLPQMLRDSNMTGAEIAISILSGDTDE